MGVLERITFTRCHRQLQNPQTILNSLPILRKKDGGLPGSQQREPGATTSTSDDVNKSMTFYDTLIF